MIEQIKRGVCMKTVVFAAWAGVGKTKLAEKYPGVVIDFESSKYKWGCEPSESNKGRTDRVLNPDFPSNYLTAIRSAIGTVPFICVAYFGVLQELSDMKDVVSYVVVPHVDDKDLYVQRYKDRGNQPSFYANVDEFWSHVEEANKSAGVGTIVLPRGGTLEEYLLSDANRTGAVLPKTMPKTTIFFDSDDVLMESTEPAIARYNELYGGSLCLEDFKAWGMDSCVPEGTTIEHFYEEPGFYRGFQPIPGMVDLVTRLKDQGHKLYVATSCTVNTIKDKVESLEEHYPFKWDDNEIIPISDKFVLSGDIFIDDKVTNVVHSKCTHKILVDRPWNQGEYPGVLRAKGVQELGRIIQECIAKGVSV